MLPSIATTISLALLLVSSGVAVVANPARVARAVSKKTKPTPAASYAGNPTADVYPPPGASVNSALFPDESVLGYPGPTPSTSFIPPVRRIIKSCKIIID